MAASPATAAAAALTTPPKMTAHTGVCEPGLSFATHLHGRLELVKKRSARSLTDCADVSKAMRELASVEEAYSRGLRKVAAQAAKFGSLSASEAVSDAVDAFRSNLKHSAELHGSLAMSISTDVEGPLNEARDELATQHRSSVSRCGSARTTLRAADEAYRRSLARYRHLLVESAQHADMAHEAGATQKDLDSAVGEAKRRVEEKKEALEDPEAGEEGRSSGGSKYSFGSWSKGMNKHKFEQWLLPTERERREQLASSAANSHLSSKGAGSLCCQYNPASLGERAKASALRKWEDLRVASSGAVRDVQLSLCEMQRTELSLAQEIRDAMRKLCVYNSSSLSNRHYDLASFSRALDEIKPADAVKAFVLRACAEGEPTEEDTTEQPASSSSPSKPPTPRSTSLLRGLVGRSSPGATTGGEASSALRFEDSNDEPAVTMPRALFPDDVVAPPKIHSMYLFPPSSSILSDAASSRHLDEEVLVSPLDVETDPGAGPDSAEIDQDVRFAPLFVWTSRTDDPEHLKKLEVLDAEALMEQVERTARRRNTLISTPSLLSYYSGDEAVADGPPPPHSPPAPKEEEEQEEEEEAASCSSPSEAAEGGEETDSSSSSSPAVVSEAAVEERTAAADSSASLPAAEEGATNAADHERAAAAPSALGLEVEEPEEEEEEEEEDDEEMLATV